MNYLKYGFYTILLVSFLGAFTFGCSSEPAQVEYEEVVLPTQGLVTVVKEVEAEQFKIDDEYTVPTTEESLIIANYLDTTSDTFTLAEAKLMQQTNGTSRGGSVVRAAAYGYFGMMMLGRMTGARPNASRYTNAKAHQKATSKAGSSLANTAKKTKRAKPGSSKSGFGKKSSGGKSSRSFGG